MSILIDDSTRVIIQGITGRDGSFHAEKMLQYGTRLVGGVTPGKGGETVHGVPVFDTVREAIDATGANASVIFVPARFAKQALLEAAAERLRLVVCVTEGVPTLDVLKAHEAFSRNGTRLIGPNCPGITIPGLAKLGIMPSQIFRQGHTGVMSRSGTLTYEIVSALSKSGIGQSACIGIGGDPIIGTRYVDLLAMFEADPDTDSVVMVGEIGGQDEIAAAEFFQKTMAKPVVAFIAGLTAPPGRRMGHAGALVGGEDETAAAKMARLEAMGIPVARVISDVPKLIAIARRTYRARSRSIPRASERVLSHAVQPG